MKNFLIKRKNIYIILIILGFFVLGIFAGIQKKTPIEKILSVSKKENPTNIHADFTPFWKTWDLLNEKYPDADKISDESRVYGAISGLVNSINDPYTMFFNPEEKKSFEEDISGKFSGIGMEVDMKDKILTVVAPLKDTPAYRAGIKPGDKILKINETLTTGLTIEEAVKIMRGDKGTIVTLTILREGEKKPQEIKITRDIINIPTLDTKLRKDGIFVITLYNFSEDSASLFRNAIKEFSNAKTDKLLLDLRGNPGGYLDSAVDMASWFLPGGKTILIEDYGDKTKQKIYRSQGYNVFNDKLKFVILIDGGSASASEIFAGAMQDHGKAKLVGSQSYGKGSVQEVINVTADTLLKVTIAKWLTPNGVSISKKGLTPDYNVEFTKEDFDNKRDPQLDKAVEILLAK